MRSIKFTAIMMAIVFSLFFGFNSIREVLPAFIIPISPFVYIIGISSAVLQILLGRVRKLPVSFPLIIVSFAYILGKISLDQVVDFTQGGHVITAVIEFVLLISSTLISGVFAASVSDFEEIMQDYIRRRDYKGIKNIIDERYKIEAEIDRSRRYNHQLTIVAIEPEKSFFDRPLNPEILDIHQYIKREYLLQKLGFLLNQETRSHDVMFTMHDNRRLLLMCPETSSQSVDLLLLKFRDIARKQFDTDLYTGKASFPQEFVTFDELLEKAETSLQHMVSGMAKVNEYKN